MSAIAGYRKLSEEDVAMINMIKRKGDDIDSFICGLENRNHTAPRAVGVPEGMRDVPEADSIDPRQLAVARTKLEEGFMHLVRAIAQPRSF